MPNNTRQIIPGSAWEGFLAYEARSARNAHVQWRGAPVEIVRHSSEERDNVGGSLPEAPPHIESQMSIAKTIIECLQMADPTVMLCGGAPRNWTFGKAANDLDFFIPDRPHLTDSDIMNWLSKVVGLPFYPKNGNYGEDRDLRVFSSVKGGMPVDVIFYKEEITPEEYAETFNHSFNHVWYDGVAIETGSMFDVYRTWDIVLIADTHPLAEGTEAKYKDWLKDKIICTNKLQVMETMQKKLKED